MPRRPTTNLAALGTTIFETMSRLAEASGAINLGQGFPDEGGPEGVIAEAVRTLREASNQYPPMAGLLALRSAIARHELHYYGLERDPATEVLVTSGATEALAATLLTLVSPGDEVLVFEPVYDCYLPMIQRAGGVVVPVRLAAPDFELSEERLRERLTSRLRVILLNNPQNPSGKVFSRAELELIVRVAQEHDAILVCDEVYEHLVFGAHEHIPAASLPGARDRTLKIGSAGKVFSMTGWKVGWVTGPAELVSLVARAHQYLTFTTPPNLQAAVAWGLDHERAWIGELTRALEDKRDRLAAGLTSLGFSVLPSAGTYFLNLDLSASEWAQRDEAFARHLTEQLKVAAIPLRSFYVESPCCDLVRFCFAKKHDVLQAALGRLSTAVDANGRP